MTGKQYRAIIAKLGLTQTGAAQFLGVGERTGHRYAADGPPEPVSRWLRYMTAASVTPAKVNKILRAA